MARRVYARVCARVCPRVCARTRAARIAWRRQAPYLRRVVCLPAWMRKHGLIGDSPLLSLLAAHRRIERM